MTNMRGLVDYLGGNRAAPSGRRGDQRPGGYVGGRGRVRSASPAGYAPSYTQRPLDDPDMAVARSAIDMIPTAYQPFPALVVNRTWQVMANNSSAALLMAGAAPDLLEPPVNMLRLCLHPLGLASQIINLAQVPGQILDRVAREAALTGDAELAELHRDLLGYPGGIEHAAAHDTGVAVPVRLLFGERELSLVGTVTTFGTAVDITLAELSIEAFLPTDSFTSQALRDLAAASIDHGGYWSLIRQKCPTGPNPRPRG